MLGSSLQHRSVANKIINTRQPSRYRQSTWLHVTIETGNQGEDAGLKNGRVYLTIARDKVLLCLPLQRDNFTKKTVPFEKPRQIDEFRVEMPKINNQEDLKMVYLQVVKGGDWFAEEMKIIDIDQQTEYIFEIKQWLSSKMNFPTRLEAKQVNIPCNRIIMYELFVLTGDKVIQAGTSARVFVKLYGSQGESNELKLSRNQVQSFNRGAFDRFLFYDYNVGNVKSIRVRHDNSGTSPGWFLDYMHLRSAWNNVEHCEGWWFFASKWLSRNEGDQSICRMFLPRDRFGSILPYLLDTDYELIINFSQLPSRRVVNLNLDLKGDRGETGYFPISIVNDHLQQRFNESKSAEVSFKLKLPFLGCLQLVQVNCFAQADLVFPWTLNHMEIYEVKSKHG